MFCEWPRLGRCCFCMPLRRGVLTFAYINLFFSAFMLGLFCYGVHYTLLSYLAIVHVGTAILVTPAEVCVVFHCLELVFSAVLIYGAHKKLMKPVQVFYYYSLVTFVALLVLQVVDTFCSTGPLIIEKSVFVFTGVCLQMYLITLVRSLIQKMEGSGAQTYENQLHPIANGDQNVDSNGIYNNTTVIPIDASD